MALSVTMTINPSGQTFHPVFNDAVYTVRETTSAIYTAANFRFICEVVVNSVVVSKLKVSIYPNSTNYGVFNVGRILESYSAYQSSHTITATTHAASSYVKYDVRFGYEYSASITTTPTEYLNVTSVTNRYAFSGAFPFTDYANYSENDWLCDDSSAKFLSRVRSREVYQGQYDFQTFLMGTTRPDRVQVIAYPSVTTSTFAIPSTSTEKMYYCPTGFNLNNIGTLISGTSGNVLPSGTTYYTIQLLTSTTARSELYTYYVKDDCSKYANNDLLFLNRLGGLQVIRMPYKRVDTYEAAKSFMQKNEYAFSSGNYTVSTSRGQRAQWDNKVQQSIAFQSGLIKETEVPLYEDLVNSPIVWMIEGSNLIAITIEDSSFVYKSYLNDKIIQYSVNAKLSFKNPTQRL
jgi:hypothetical protein